MKLMPVYMRHLLTAFTLQMYELHVPQDYETPGLFHGQALAMLKDVYSMNTFASCTLFTFSSHFKTHFENDREG